MSKHPRRYYGTKELHFITCSCHQRQAWLASPQRRDLFLTMFEEVRLRRQHESPTFTENVKMGRPRCRLFEAFDQVEVAQGSMETVDVGFAVGRHEDRSYGLDAGGI
jgi:hypothetical protein